jgi:UDP-3-O-[3-hydroxymyristoyl] N-acetylglucosamine deacetylase/3-hydroxyacyl-[acyl-carrier-protein] dehydratase
LSNQTTIRNSVSVEGLGLFGGQPCSMRFLPAHADCGIVFVRTDRGKAPLLIAADVSNVAKRPRRSCLTNGSATVETVEHVLSAAWGMGIDNIQIELSADETPSTDGSPLPFVEALKQAGVEEQAAPQKLLVISEPVAVSEGDAMIAALPGPADCLDILYDLDYTDRSASVARQVMAFCMGKDDYAAKLAPARTFLLEEEATAFQAQGLGKHLTYKDVLVMADRGPIENELRFPDEHVRHKMVDLIGDLALLGRRIRGRIVAYKSGHELNHTLVRKLAQRAADRTSPLVSSSEPVMDIRKIMRLLPHRYPFLMIDRVVEIDGDHRAVAIKNVSINEPFFQGHYPGQPIMPGVMIVEAMAQLSGILLSRRLEHTGKVAVLLSMDRVKMRRTVRPGDQLTIEAETLHVRSRTGHCRCRALVGQEVAAEAEIKFMLVDAEPV